MFCWSFLGIELSVYREVHNVRSTRFFFKASLFKIGFESRKHFLSVFSFLIRSERAFTFRFEIFSLSVPQQGFLESRNEAAEPIIIFFFFSDSLRMPGKLDF